MTLPRWIFGLLFISLTGAQELKEFPENFVVAKKNDVNPVTLTCGTKTDGAVQWKFEGNLMELDDENLVMRDIDRPDLGRYSCWREGQEVSSTYLLLKAEEGDEKDDDTEDSLIKCRAKSYDCTFTCQWTHSGYSAVRMGLGHECTEGGKSCPWVNSSDKLPDGGFQFELSHPLPPYAEESTMLEVTAEAITNFLYVRKTKRFYLRDIVRPDSPQIVKCEEVGDSLNVTIHPPTSWSTPHSFFSLEHQIQYVIKDDGTRRLSSSTLIPKEISQLRVRSRDPLVPPAWSEWTPWKNVKSETKDPNKCKNKARSCHLELPSDSLEDCKKKKKNGRKKRKNSKQSRKS